MKNFLIATLITFLVFCFFSCGFFLWVFKTSSWMEILIFDVMRSVPGIATIVCIVLCITKYKSKKAEQQLQANSEEISRQAQEKVSTLEKEIQRLEKSNNRYKQLNGDIADLEMRINRANTELLIAETTVYEPSDNITSEETKDQLTVLKLEYKDFIKSEKAVNITNAAAYDKKKRLNDNIKQILRCFNSEAVGIISAVSATNIEKQRSALTKSFETINSIFASDGLALDKQLLEYRLRELGLVYAYQEKKAREHEEQKAIRAQMLEEEKVRREIEREKAKVEKEETQFKNEVDKLTKYLSQAADEVQKQIYVDKIKELEEKIKLLEKDKENILQREQNTRAGFVYIISNIGSFGENIYKIGMTRRLEPMERIDELGSASVPFPFDVHAMIFSEDAPALETTLHNTFREHQVNLVNPRKEFYNVHLADVERVVKENYNATVTFTQVAEAAQYRESVKIRQANNNIKGVENMPLCSICRLNRVENEGDVCSDCSLQPEISYPYSNNNKETDKTLKREVPNNTYTRFDSALTNVFPSNNEEEDEEEFEM